MCRKWTSDSKRPEGQCPVRDDGGLAWREAVDVEK